MGPRGRRQATGGGAWYDPPVPGRRPSDAIPRPAYDLQAWRRRIPAFESLIPLANCSHGPANDITRRALEAYLASWSRDVMDWDTWMEQVDGAKDEFARLINASPHEIALVPSVTAATASLASCLDYHAPRNRVLVTESEFPSVGHVWLAQRKYGAVVDWVPLREGVVSLDDLDAGLDERTLVVSACHAYYVNGFRQDVAAIAQKAHERGALLFVDAYQTVGVYPVDVKALDVDVLASGAHKFLMGVPGIAFLYVRRELIPRLRPALTGWFGRAEIFDFDVKQLDWADTARRFELATPPVADAFVAKAAIAAINEVGIDAIHAWTTELSRRLIDGGRARGLVVHGTADVDRKTPTTAFVCPGESRLFEDAMRGRGVLVASRGPVVRIAPHFFNNVEDVEIALDTLADLISKHRSSSSA